MQQVFNSIITWKSHETKNQKDTKDKHPADCHDHYSREIFIVQPEPVILIGTTRRRIFLEGGSIVCHDCLSCALLLTMGSVVLLCLQGTHFCRKRTSTSPCVYVLLLLIQLVQDRNTPLRNRYLCHIYAYLTQIEKSFRSETCTWNQGNVKMFLSECYLGFLIQDEKGFSQFLKNKAARSINEANT